jgi:hypothetical protein
MVVSWLFYASFFIFWGREWIFCAEVFGGLNGRPAGREK